MSVNLRDSYLRSATTSKASLEGVDLTVPGVDRDEPLFPAVDTKPASSGDEEPKIESIFFYFTFWNESANIKHFITSQKSPYLRLLTLKNFKPFTIITTTTDR